MVRLKQQSYKMLAKCTIIIITSELRPVSMHFILRHYILYQFCIMNTTNWLRLESGGWSTQCQRQVGASAMLVPVLCGCWIQMDANVRWVTVSGGWQRRVGQWQGADTTGVAWLSLSSQGWGVGRHDGEAGRYYVTQKFVPSASHIIIIIIMIESNIVRRTTHSPPYTR